MWPVRGDGSTGSVPVIVAPVTDRQYGPRSSQTGWIVLVWLLLILLASLVGKAAVLRPAALFAHLIFLAIGFGASLAIGLNWVALMLRWVRVSRVVTVGVVLDPLIWIGLSGLCLTGLVLGPDVGRGWTWVKFLAVLAVALNVLWSRDLFADLGRLPGKAGRRSLSPALLHRVLRLSITSQVGWWLCVIIGFVTTNR